MHILHVIKYNTERSSFSVQTSGVRPELRQSYNSGMKEDDMDKIAEIIAMVIESEEKCRDRKKTAAELTREHPL